MRPQGARQGWRASNRVRLTLGLGTRETSRAMKSSGSKMTWVVPSRYGVFSWVAPAHPCARDISDSIHVITHVAIGRERQPPFRHRWPCNIAAQTFQLLAFIGPGRDPRMQRESSHLAHLVIERLIATRQSLQREHLATLASGPTAMRYVIEWPKSSSSGSASMASADR